MSQLKNYLSLIKFSHTIFAMPFALIGFFLASTSYQIDGFWKLLGLVILCMVFARSAAMAFNRLVDRVIDTANPRTVNLREIPKGVISPNAARTFVALNCLAFVTTTYFINPLCFALSPIALLVVLGYSYTKRFTAFCHLILGLGLSLAPLGAYLAVSGVFHILPSYFSLAVLCWVAGFDIMYSLQDQSFDKEQKLHSIPVWMGKKNALKLSKALHLITFCCLLYAGVLINGGLFYWLGLSIFSSLLVYQHTLVKADDLSRINIAFFTTNGIASILFGLFTILELIGLNK